MNLLDRMQPVGLLILRLALGAVMLAHGFPKAFGGLQHHVEIVRSLHLPGWMAYLSVAAEVIGGILLIVGFFTRFSAFAVFINMLVAIFGVHFKNGFLGQGNYQFPLTLAAIAFALIFSGAGPISIDGLRGKAR
ncbi:MAG TPA: DoxX family protein [Verrucomicrobiae bacterium]|nr:DoxX family protein [Verrucomicrobiae bacterium]